MVRKRHTGTSKATVKEVHDRFVKAYIANGENATRAYLEVKPHVTKGAAAVQGYRLLKLSHIQKAIEHHRNALRARFALTADRVYEELGRLSYFNPKNLFKADGTAKTLQEIDDNEAAALSAIEIEGGKIVRWRAHDKNAALEKVVKILRLNDTPPPPPPDQQDERPGIVETARRLHFVLAAAGHKIAHDAATQRVLPVKKKITLPA